MRLTDRLRSLADDGSLELPEIGAGDTPARWRALHELAREDVSLGRLAEAHVDGRQILGEVDLPHPAQRLVGVWASEHPRWTVTATSDGDTLVLHGAKAFCTGAGIVDDALVTVATPDGPLLVLVPLDGLAASRVDGSGWQAHALADTCTAVVDLEGIEVPVDAVVDPPGWYLDRPGFWLGAVGPAACWGGAAAGLVDHAMAQVAGEPHALAHLGAMVAAAWAIEAVLAEAGRKVDAGIDDAPAARRLALTVRHLVDHHCAEIQDHFGRALGPRPLVGDPAVIERNDALTIYRRQCHAERDLEGLGHLTTPT